ncbi:helix-turn-helix domain-containing protein [Megalodesulfovibrio gigas]|uniref:HTH marR-type domain-containing protein n=1 Tax=Megalodesulfovibrio gigas (strain ATCC 19364 / DSM 1382 / NCIMB 9332 / VKM B-1759) TaxID=1121448 RepID=T2GBU1_MEGG1|nr:hypothetical protein [Megalodesulfovibrio gigas]AGW13773.1 hypothetical protein DGI_1999 [Megalodesulfovibrio gigas DSM 1382 = ATCC 19364]
MSRPLSAPQEDVLTGIDAAGCSLAETLAAALGRTPGQVERTLYALSDRGLVAGVACRGRCGWVLTPAGTEAVDAIRAAGSATTLADRWC